MNCCEYSTPISVIVYPAPKVIYHARIFVKDFLIMMQCAKHSIFSEYFGKFGNQWRSKIKKIAAVATLEYVCWL